MSPVVTEAGVLELASAFAALATSVIMDCGAGLCDVECVFDAWVALSAVIAAASASSFNRASFARVRAMISREENLPATPPSFGVSGMAGVPVTVVGSSEDVEDAAEGCAICNGVEKSRSEGEAAEDVDKLEEAPRIVSCSW